MPDWQKLVRERFSSLALDESEKEEVCAELAAHLEETYEGLCKQGLHEKEAAHRSLEQVSNWQDLQRKIFAAKRGERSMKKRAQQLWIPGFLALILSTFSLMTAQTCGFQPPILWSGPVQILVYVPWLASLPFFGALGAYLSYRAGGSRRTALLASVFPTLALAAAFVLMFPIDLIVKWIMGIEVNFGIVATSILRDGIGWLLLPGAALLVGGLLASLLFGRPSSSQGAAIGGETTHA